jgi:FkbH-like protein
MTFLEAQQILARFRGGEEFRFVFAMSGTSSPFELYLRAGAAKHGRSAVIEFLPFNTLAQRLLQPGVDREVFLLLPWDFVPELDWRSGLPSPAPAADQLETAIARYTSLFASRSGARYVYLPAATPPVLANSEQNEALRYSIASAAKSIGAAFAPAEAFSLEIYLASGCPVGGRQLGSIAETVVAKALEMPVEPRKVLVSDLDNVLWGGVIAEDTVDGIHCEPEGLGYRHFVYQTMLKRLVQQGTLVAAVSRNDPGAIAPAFQSGRMVLTEADFVAIVASYNPKSSQIRQLSQELNIGLDAFVFVDDNPVELEEVHRQLPQVSCVRFPESAEELPAVLDEIVRVFPKRTVTREDLERTALYRRRLAGMAPSDMQGADLTSFLRELEMRLEIHDRTEGDRARAVQLINKTNQFNLNGRRISDEDVARILTSGGKLFTATLADRTGSHGEILACLLDSEGVVRSFVMSCRVFQRQVEFAFLAWLIRQEPVLRFDFKATERNEPLRRFFDDDAFTPPVNGVVALDAARFAEAHSQALSIMAVVTAPVSTPA